MGGHIFVGNNIERIEFSYSSSSGRTKYEDANFKLILHMSSPTPPSVSGDHYGFTDATVYVPKGSVAAYRSKKPWSDTEHYNILEEPQKLERLQLSQHTLILDSNETVTLTASPMPSDAANVDIHWSSSNDSVAMVSADGTVTGVRSGEAYIFAMSGKIKDSCKVTVITHVTGIEINPNDVTFDKIGQTRQLQAIITPDNATNKNVTWKSMNESVCMVTNSGYVTALGVGSTVIIATSEDGSIPATCVITVNEPNTGIDTVNKGNSSQSELYTIN